LRKAHVFVERIKYIIYLYDYIITYTLNNREPNNSKRWPTTK